MSNIPVVCAVVRVKCCVIACKRRTITKLTPLIHIHDVSIFIRDVRSVSISDWHVFVTVYFNRMLHYLRCQRHVNTDHALFWKRSSAFFQEEISTSSGRGRCQKNDPQTFSKLFQKRKTPKKRTLRLGSRERSRDYRAVVDEGLPVQASWEWLDQAVTTTPPAAMANFQQSDRHQIWYCRLFAIYILFIIFYY